MIELAKIFKHYDAPLSFFPVLLKVLKHMTIICVTYQLFAEFPSLFVAVLYWVDSGRFLLGCSSFVLFSTDAQKSLLPAKINLTRQLKNQPKNDVIAATEFIFQSGLFWRQQQIKASGVSCLDEGLLNLEGPSQKVTSRLV